MLYGGMTNRRKIVILLLALFAIMVIFVTIIIYQINYKGNSYEEQTVMADKYMKEGKYEKAIKVYQNALSMKNSDQEFLSLRMAEAYIAIYQYDSALEVLRSCYQKTSGIRIKEKIEEVTALKTEYEFQQALARAQTYYTNKEYDKAITEYGKAKLIKSKDIATYNGIAKAYIDKGEYQKAREEVLAGLELTQSEELEKTLTLVDSFLLKERYENIVKIASEYIYQENYEDAIAKYEEAINLMPNEEKAYYGLSELYINLDNYDKAVTLLQSALKQMDSNTLDSLMEQVVLLKDKKEETDRIISEIYASVNDLDIEMVDELMKEPFIMERLAEGTPVYYDPEGGNTISSGYGMVIYDENNIYSGDFASGLRNGMGTYLLISREENLVRYYYYTGEWKYDFPHGIGKVVDETIQQDGNGNTLANKVKTEGNYGYAKEDGLMHKYLYENNEEIGNLVYTAANGIPSPLYDEDGNIIKTGKNSDLDAIGILYKGKEPTKEYYGVKSGTVWGVEPFVQQE